jgi:hypothetical protein
VDIEVRRNGKKWIAEVWENLNEMQERDTLSEERYTEINHWCVSTFGYHARTAYHIFEFKKQSDLDWFVIRWS